MKAAQFGWAAVLSVCFTTASYGQGPGVFDGGGVFDAGQPQDYGRFEAVAPAGYNSPVVQTQPYTTGPMLGQVSTSQTYSNQTVMPTTYTTPVASAPVVSNDSTTVTTSAVQAAPVVCPPRTQATRPMRRGLFRRFR